jgi:hypothetical protein
MLSKNQKNYRKRNPKRGESMELTKQEKEVLKSLVEYHLKEVKSDMSLERDFAALFGAEVKYEAILRGLLKKLK